MSKRNKKYAPQKKLQQQLDALSKQFKQHYAAGNYVAALQHALSAHRVIPKNPTPLSDAAACAIYLEQWEKAVHFGKQVLALDNNHINAFDALSHAHDYLKNTASAKQFGERALRLRDAPFAKQANTQSAPSIPIDAQQLANGKKIISFSLYGDSSAYNEPAVINTELQARIYPDWQCRFYVDNTVPETTIQRLKENQTEVILVTKSQQQLPGTMWRFLALDDPTVGRVIFRDADAVISEREAVAVKEWEASKAPFHLIRDAGSHTELILAGLWGAVAGSIQNISTQMHDYITQQGDALSGRFADQFFLRERVWTSVRSHSITHSNLFDFMETRPLPPININGRQLDHIGNDEGNSTFSAQNQHADGTTLYWSLHSKLSPYITLDGKQAELPEERLICTYPATQTNGAISGKIPRRYARGIKTGLTRITLNTQAPTTATCS